MISKKILISMMAMMVLCTGAISLVEYSNADDPDEDNEEFDTSEEEEGSNEEEQPGQNITISNNAGLVVGSLVILFCMVMFVLFIGRMVLK